MEDENMPLVAMGLKNPPEVMMSTVIAHHYLVSMETRRQNPLFAAEGGMTVH